MEHNSQVDIYLIRAKKIIDIIKKKLLVIVGLSAIIAIAVYFKTKYEDNVYVGSLNFVVESDSKGGGSGLSGIASQFGIDMSNSGTSMFSGSNINEFLKSRSIIERTLREKIFGQNETLLDHYLIMKFETVDNIPEVIKTAIKFPNEKNSHNRVYDSIMSLLHEEILNKHLNIFQKDKKVGITTVQVLSSSEVFSKCFVESLVRVASDFYTDFVSKKAKINLDILQKQVDSVRVELGASISDVARVSDNTFNLNPAYQIMKVPASKNQVDVQISSVVLNQLVSNLEVAKINLRKETPLIQVVDTPKYPLPVLQQSPVKFSLFAFAFSMILFTGLLLVKQQFDIIQTRYKQIIKNND